MTRPGPLEAAGTIAITTVAVWAFAVDTALWAQEPLLMGTKDVAPCVGREPAGLAASAEAILPFVTLQLPTVGTDLHPAEGPFRQPPIVQDSLELFPFRDCGQTPRPPSGSPSAPRHAGVKAMLKDLVEDAAHVPSMENLLWAGAGGGVALAVYPADDDVIRWLSTSEAADTFFKPGKVIGAFPTLLSSAATVYVVGRSLDQPRVSSVGVDLIQSLIISEALTQAIKRTVRRERPDGTTHTSFPSGHSADTFAFATALERHLGWRSAIPAYLVSSYVAMSRLPSNRHWPSDVVFGSVIGIIAGRTVTRQKQDSPIQVAAVPGGVVLIFIRQEHRADALHSTTVQAVH
jgi:membrane-associated phospholipid phosphatase